MESAVGIVWLDQVTGADAAKVGGKAANLGELIRIGMPVPPGFVVDTSSYVQHARRSGLRAAVEPMIQEHDWVAVERTVVRLLCSHPLPNPLRLELSDAVRRLGAPTLVARSSATSEDLDEASFAGQYRTLLNLDGEIELQQAIEQCWASLWCQRAMEYRDQRSIDHFSNRMAVIIQSMVAADVSGVVFTVDPVAQRSDRMMIEVIAGPGEALVSGTESGLVCRVDRASLEVVDREGEGHAPRLILEDLCSMALDVESHFGCPQDIEFVARRGKISLLQSRPITTLGEALPEPLEPLGKPKLCDRLMRPLVMERYAIAPRPLDNLIYTDLVGAAIAGLRRSGVVVTEAAEVAFRAEVWRQAYRFPPHRLTWRFLFSGWQLISLLRTDWLRWWDGGPGPMLRGATAPVDLSVHKDAELFERAEAILAAWREPLTERMYAASAYRAEWGVKLLTTMAVGRRKRDGVFARLMGGLTHPTLETNAELWQLSRRARQTPSVRSAVRDLDPKQLESTREGRQFLRAFGDFLDAYGHRESTCWYLSTPTWRCDPMQVWRLLRSISEVDEPRTNSEQADKDYQRARDLVERRLRFIPGLRSYFRWLLHAVRDLTVFRERSHFDLTRVLAALQEIATEWGRRLVERGVLNVADDVFYLTYHEVRDWLLSDPPETNVIRKLLAQRRATYQLANTRWQSQRHDGGHRGAVLKGIATSVGVVTGKARIIRGEHQFERLRPGEILVCPYTTPAWTPLFTSAAAVVTETGGAASHASIVAREYGIPAVMGVRGAMRVLDDGMEILVDGDRGIVRPIRKR
jgi:phosphohistidine swiveling domain-containing protein